MKRTLLASLAALLAAGTAPAQAQGVKVYGLVQVWYTQMLNSDLRTDGLAKTNGNAYYDLNGNYTENSFLIRRSEIHVGGAIPNVDGLSFEINIDPSINTGTGNPTILQDATLNYKAPVGLEFTLGQFHNQQTLEGMTSASVLVFAERSQLGRRFGDKRDRGLTVALPFGDQDFGGKATVGVFNGMTDATSGKTNDTNAQKDFVGRLEFHAGKEHTFGVYTLQGQTDQADKGALVAQTFAGTSAPSAADILSDKDKTTNYGAYYDYNNGTWHFIGEMIAGNWGRRASSLGTAAGAAKREALDQKFMSYYATAAYTTGAHTFALRYDFLNANQGDKWYTDYNPYTESAPGVSRGVDYTPKYTEITAGYTYAFNPQLLKAANIKLNYIHRSKNFLAPGATETGEQGGDSFIAAFQIAF